MFKAEKISKKYPGTLALQNVDIEIRRGEVTGVIGENGAGKSTLLRIMMGVEQPTTGTMTMNGKTYAPGNPIQVNNMGVGMVFQEQSLIQNLTVGQNIFLGRENEFKKSGFINWKKMNESAEEALSFIGLDISPRKKISSLDFANRQMVEIAKVLKLVRANAASGSLILLDEPTSVLNDSEVKKLFDQVEILKNEGNSIVFVSHRLDEVMQISDRIYIFKDGEKVGAVDAKDADELLLYAKMVGRSTTGEYYKVNKQTEPKAQTVLEVKNLSLKGYFKNVSFKLHKGEILGICGVVGSGKEKVCEVICGDAVQSSGDLFINGKHVNFSSPNSALKSGILSIPKERRDEGIVGILSVLENITLSSLKSLKRFGLVSRKLQREKAEEWRKNLSIKCSSYKDKINSLSGGNAQKVVFARILSSESNILVLNHPTRGVDVGAKEDIYAIIRDITASGRSVILLGDTLDECIGLSNKIVVMKDGTVTKEFDAPPHNKPEQLDIVKYMM